MRRIQLLAVGAALAVVLTVPSFARAGTSTDPGDSREDIADVYYDWEVWIAEHVSGFKVYFENDHGDVGKGGWFDTKEEAEEAVAEFESDPHIRDAWIVPYSGPGPWEYLNTFDKRADAEAVAAKAEAFGFYAAIQRVKGYQSALP